MKNTKSKKLNKEIITLCDFQPVLQKNNYGDTEHPTGTDPTNTTIITITTVNTGILFKR